MTTVIFLLAILCLSLQNILYKKISGFIKGQADTLLFSGMIVSIVAGLSGLLSFQKFVWDIRTVFFGILFGIFFALCEFSYMMALSRGSMSYTSLFLTCSLVIPTIGGILLWGETVKRIQIAGIMFLIVSFVLILKTDKNREGISLKWLLFGILTFLSNGMVSVIQKMQQLVVGEKQNGEFMMISFMTATVLLWLICLLRMKGENTRVLKELKKVKKTFFYITLAAAASTAGNQMVLYSAAKMEASVMFPVMNGGILILCSLAAAAFFKEKLSKRQQIGMGIGIVSVMLISM